MGYMGLGMQRWIYTMKARRPFSKDRKPKPFDVGEDEIEFNPKMPPSYSKQYASNEVVRKARSNLKTSWLGYKMDLVVIIIIGVVFFGFLISTIVFVLK